MSNRDEAAPPPTIDLEAHGLGHMARYARTATFATNWRSVLCADGLVGLVVIALGILAMRWIAILGWVVAAIGAVYLVLVLRRALQWRWLRQQVGLH